MKFLIIIICLTLTPYVKLQPRLSRYNPLQYFFNLLATKLELNQQAWLVFIILVLPPTMLVFFTGLLLKQQGFGLGYFLFTNLVLLYCFSSAPNFVLTDFDSSKLDKSCCTVLWQYLIQYFAPLFWFAILGNLGIAAAFCYRLISLAHALAQDKNLALIDLAAHFHGTALWLPTHFLGLTFTLLAPQRVAALKSGLAQAYPHTTPGIRYNVLADSSDFLAFCAQVYLSQQADMSNDTDIQLINKLIKHSLNVTIIIVTISNLLSLVI